MVFFFHSLIELPIKKVLFHFVRNLDNDAKELINAAIEARNFSYRYKIDHFSFSKQFE